MNRYEEGLKLIEESCGNSKDNVIALSTIALESTQEGQPYPYVRQVDAFYEDGVFYVTTWGKSNKIKQIEKNNQVAFTVGFDGISGFGRGENLGWVMDPKNAAIREKVRYAFRDWYDDANNEKDENCVLLAIHMKKTTIFRDHGATVYNLDFENKCEF